MFNMKIVFSDLFLDVSLSVAVKKYQEKTESKYLPDF